jgi:antitoxin ChpS
MELSIAKWGNSAAVRLPTKLLTAEELVAQCDTNASEPADMVAWRMVKPWGREVL